MLISIILPTYNRCEFLAKAAESLMSQEIDDSLTFEILVVDDASTDGTSMLVRELTNRYGNAIRLIEGEGEGVAPARNKGIKEAKGEWIAFMDDDQLAGPGWLISLTGTALSKGTRCVVGKRLLLLPGPIRIPLGPHLRSYLGEEAWGEKARLLLPEEFPNTGNALLKKDLFGEVGCFDPSNPYGGDDTEFFFRLKKAGVSIWYTPDAVMYHVISEDRLNEQYLRTKAHRDGISMAMIDHRHGPSYGLPMGLLKWCILAVFRRRWFFQEKSPEKDFDGKYIGWYAWGYLRQTSAYLFPGLFKNNRFFRDLQFRKVHKKGR